MKNDNIAKSLKFYRKQNNLSVRDVAEQLSVDQNIVAEKTVYGWESGQTQPDADILLKLCKIYHIDNILGAFGYDENVPFYVQPTTFEMKLLKSYREHPELHPAIHKLLGVEDVNTGVKKKKK